MKIGALPREWIDLGIFTAAAFLLYQFGALFFLMSVPLFILGFKRGREYLLYALGIILGMVLLQVFIRTRGIESGVLQRFFFVLEIVYPLGILAGIAAVFWGKGRVLYRLLTGTAAVLIISLPVAGIYSGSQEVAGFLREQTGLILEALKSSVNNTVATGETMMLATLDAEAVYELILQLFVKNYIFSFFLVLSAGWLVADRLYSRFTGGTPFSLTGFHVPELLLWPILGAWTGVLLDVTAGIPVIGFLFWNYGMILLSIFALQGAAILKFLFGQYGVSRLIQTLVVFSAVIVLMTPRINLVLIVGVPLLGLSEIWVRYRAVNSA
ncbi:MAG: hypothetical protein ACP5IA_12765 [Sediminispirochaetaceae bacterium]